MAIEVILYGHNKRINSTLQPSTNARYINGVMKNGSDFLNPVISFNIEMPTDYNYAKIADFGNRYYYIDNWTNDNGLWTATMSVDVLATYKNAIGESRAHVLRSATKSDEYIMDSLYTPTTLKLTETVEASLPEASIWKNGGDVSKGGFVVGVVNNDVDALGSVSYYQMDNLQIKNMLHSLMGGFDWLNITEVTQELAQALFNPFQYIVSCLWFPRLPLSGSAVTSLPYGWWTLQGVEAYRLRTTTLTQTAATLTLESHPEMTDSEKLFLNAKPFTNHVLFAEPWGSFEIPGNVLNGDISLEIKIDYITGKGLLYVKNFAGEVVAYKETMVGVPIQLSQMTTNVLEVGQSFINAALTPITAAFSGRLDTAISNTTSGIVGAVESTTPELANKGCNGSPFVYGITPFTVSEYIIPKKPDVSIFGKPYCKTEKISNLSGYVLCSNPSIAIPNALEYETRKINSFLAEGFYYE